MNAATYLLVGAAWLTAGALTAAAYSLKRRADTSR